jgi:hypothetical protein
LKQALDTSRLLAKIHHEQPLQIVESSEAGLFLLRKLSRVSYVVRLHGGHRFFAASIADTPFLRRKALFEQLSLKKADSILDVSHYVLQKNAAFYPFILQKPHTVIPNPVFLHRFSTPASTQAVPGRLLFMGAITKKKRSAAHHGHTCYHSQLVHCPLAYLWQGYCRETERYLA